MNIQSLLKDIDHMHIRETYIRITLLSFSNENPLKTIEGKVVSGSINIDGTSATRRTANLEILIEDSEEDMPTIQKDISINKKIKIEIGLKNNLSLSQNYELNTFLTKNDIYNKDFQSEYEIARKFLNKKNNLKYKNLEYQDNIFWFNQGIYIIKSVSFSHSLENITASLNLVDKMALLDGTCGGVLPATTIFHELEDVGEDGEIIIRKPTIYQIIQELVHHIGKEQLGKIIIDLDTEIKQVVRWMGSGNLYLKTNTTNSNDNQYSLTSFDQDEDSILYTFNPNDDVGFVVTDFVYPNELIGSAGETVVSILDKIKETLGNYEYFYDVNGFFHFQEIKNYLNITKASSVLNEQNNANILANNTNGQHYQVYSNLDKTEYNFNNSNLITSYNNSPNYDTIKNDFIVWGMKKSNGSSFPIRYHVAIDTKPHIKEEGYEIVLYEDEEENVVKAVAPTFITNPSEMQKDINHFYCYQGINYKRYKIHIGKPPLTSHERRTNTVYYANDEYYPYDSDNPLNVKEIYSSNYHKEAENYFLQNNNQTEVYLVIKRGNNLLNCYLAKKNENKNVIKYVHKTSQVEIIEGLPPLIGRKTNAIYWTKDNEGYHYYDFSSDFPLDTSIHFINKNAPFHSIEYFYSDATTFEDCLAFYYEMQIDTNDNNKPIRAYKYQLCENISSGTIIVEPKDWRSELFLQGCVTAEKGLEGNEYYVELLNEWLKIYDLQEEKFTVPETDLNYFLDFLDMPKYEQFSIQNIGKRTEILNNEQINCIFETDIPDIIMIDPRDKDQEDKKTWAIKKGYTWSQVNSDIYDNLSIGGIKNSAYEAMKDLLYQHLSYSSSISLESIPIYYLEPNIRISVEDKLTNIFGDYMITSISYSFDSSATMSIQANETLERIF